MRPSEMATSQACTVIIVMLMMAVQWEAILANNCSCPETSPECTQEPQLGLCRHTAYETTYYTRHTSYSRHQTHYDKYSCGWWGRRCNRYWITYSLAYKPTTVTSSKQICQSSCCEGYSAVSANKCAPICSPPCQNGGSCTAPNVCSCLPGYTGLQCEHEILIMHTKCPMTVNEDASAVHCCLRVNIPFDKPTRIPLTTTGGSAEVQRDYVGSYHEIVFQRGNTQACGSISIIDDNDCELTETVSVNLAKTSDSSDYHVGEPASCLLQITDNDRVQISFAQDMYQMEENAEEIEVCAVASCPCPQKITVSLSLQSGTALPGVDYPEQSLDFTFNVNEDKVCTTVRILNDIIPEAREHFRINLMADSEYDILDPSYTTIIISDIDKYCKPPPNLPGINYIGLNSTNNLLLGQRIPFSCKEGFVMLNQHMQDEGPRGLSVCNEHYWDVDKYCFDIKECNKSPKVCERSCRETEGSYQCLCNSGEKLDDNGYSCNKECGHLRAPEGIEVDYRIVASELQKAVLSCSEDKVFPGGKTTITQYCLQGHWEYEEKPNATDIPGCQALHNTSGKADIEVHQHNVSCKPNRPVNLISLSLQSFADPDQSDVQVDAQAFCKETERKRSTGYVVLHFTVHKPIAQSCNTYFCIYQQLLSLRPTVLKVLKVIKSNSLQVNLSTDNESITFYANPNPVLTGLKQSCEEGSVFKDNQCIHCTPGSYYDQKSNVCRFCPLNQYQQKRGQTSCELCPLGRITRRQGTQSMEGCIVTCKPGQFSTEGDGYELCLPCPDGSWQNETGASFCYACDYYQQTGREGATNSSECGCPADTFGQNCSRTCNCKNGGTCLYNGVCICQGDWIGNDCSLQKCPPELVCYPGVTCTLDANNETQCGSCPEGSTGDGVHCLPLLCPTGSFYNVTENICKPCPVSQYQDEVNQISCKVCPMGKTTRKIGADSERDCTAYSESDVKSNVYVASFLKNYASKKQNLVMFLSSHNTIITDLAGNERVEYSLSGGTILRLNTSAATNILAWRTNANASVLAIGVNREKGSSDVFNIYKVSNLLRNEKYYAITPPSGSSRLQSTFMISAFYNKTEVQLLGGSKWTTRTSGKWNISESNAKYLLNSLDYLYITADSDLTGFGIHTNKPVSVFSGHHCANIPVGVSSCDHVVEQIPPVSEWGKTFILSTFIRNVQVDFIKVVASTDGTNVRITCIRPNTTDSEVILDELLNSTNHIQFKLPSMDTCILNSSSPVLVVQFSTGGSTSPTSEGDPSMTVVPHLGQYFPTGQLEFISPKIPHIGSNYKHFANVYIYYPPGVNITTPTLDGNIMMNIDTIEDLLEGSVAIYKSKVRGGVHCILASGHVTAIVYGYRTSEMYSYSIANI